MFSSNNECIHSVMEPAGHVSDRYKHLPDNKFLQPLFDRGFITDSVETKGVLGTRLIRMSHPQLRIGDDRIQVVAVNSHDGTKAFNLFLGIFRMVCSNGLIVGDSFTEKKPIRHIGEQFYAKVDRRVEELVAKTTQLLGTVNKMKETRLGQEELFNLSNKALSLRFKDDIEKNKSYQLTRYGTLGHVFKRQEDRDNTLWVIFNRLQEDLIRGGFTYKIHSKGETQVRDARAINNIDEKIRINAQLWDLVQGVVA